MYSTVMVCEPRLEVFGAMGNRYTQSEKHITPYKRCSLTRGSSVRYVGIFNKRVPHYGFRGLGALNGCVVTHKL